MVINFTPRLKKPEKGNKYYNKKPTGYNPCILGKPQDKGCNVLANCVGYVVGRFSEETNEGCCKWFGSMNAKSFYEAAKKMGLEVGQTPKAGAIMCWSGGKNGMGHVAISEIPNGLAETKTSESAYEGSTFYTKTRKKGKDGNWGMSSNYKFQGFIYNPHIIEVEKTKPVERNIEINQLEVIKDKLRIRTEPSLKGEILGFAEKGYYNDLETKVADGYTWHKVDEYNWLADVDGYVKLLPKIEFNVGDKVTFKELPDYFVITSLENTIANVSISTSTNNLNKLD
jgi:hypothetical protein